MYRVLALHTSMTIPRALPTGLTMPHSYVKGGHYGLLHRIPPNPYGKEAMSTYDPAIVASLAHDPAALRAYLDAQNTGTKPATPAKSSRKRSSARASAKPASKPARSSKRREAKPAPTEWIVKPEWAGVPASPRMVAAALHYGVPVATCNKLAGDKLALSTAIGRKRGLPVVTAS